MVLVVLKPTAGAAEELESLQGKQGGLQQEVQYPWQHVSYDSSFIHLDPGTAISVIVLFQPVPLLLLIS